MSLELSRFSWITQLLAILYHVHRGTCFTAQCAGLHNSEYVRGKIRSTKSSLFVLTNLVLGCSKRVRLEPIYPH